MMKSLIAICGIVFLLLFVGLAGKNNPLAEIAEEYFKRAGKHLEDNNYSASFALSESNF